MTRGVDKARAHRAFRRLNGTAAVWLLNGAIFAAAVTIFLVVVRHQERIDTPVEVPWWMLAIGFALTEVFVIHFHFRRSAHSMSLGEVPLVVGLVLCDPTGVVIAQVIASALVLGIGYRPSPIRLVFNVAQYALVTALAVAVFHALVLPDSGPGSEIWLGAFVATTVGGALAPLLIGAAVTLSESPIGLARLGQMVSAALFVTATNTALGLAGATLVAADPTAVWLLMVPAATIFVAYRAYISERQKHESLEFLQQATRTLARSSELAPSLQDLLGQTLQAFRAEVAEIVLFSPEEEHVPLRTVVGPGDHMETMAPVSREVATALRAFVDGDRQAVHIDTPVENPALGAHLFSLGIQHAMVAALVGETRVVGTIMLGNRLGVTSAFGADDLKLFETLANQAAVSLEHDRLEQTVWRLKELQEQLQYQAFHDPLTGLVNRALLTERLEHALARRDSAVSVLFLDLDDFKTVNDTQGHAQGDELLVRVAERIKTCVRPADTPARLGGDEFAVLVEQSSDDDVLEVVDRIMGAVSAPFTIGGNRISVHASIGIAMSDSRSTAEVLLRNADVAMYTAKSEGKGRYAIFEEQMHAAVLRRHSLKEALRRAIEEDQLVIHYQPIVDLSTGETLAAEALVRWEHPELGLTSPAEFIPIAEESGLIIQVGAAVLRKACRQAKLWDETDPDLGRLAIQVNLSAIELHQPGLIERVAAILRETGLEADRLVLEITESILMDDSHFSITRLQELRDLGVRLALDDFGTGYSSLSYLRWLPIDILKVAKSFVDGTGGDPEQTTFSRLIIELAHTLRLQVVAEGIETAEQHDSLRALGCEMGQGFYFTRPLAADELLAAARRAHDAQLAR